MRPPAMHSLLTNPESFRESARSFQTFPCNSCRFQQSCGGCGDREEARARRPHQRAGAAHSFRLRSPPSGLPARPHSPRDARRSDDAVGGGSSASRSSTVRWQPTRRPTHASRRACRRSRHTSGRTSGRTHTAAVCEHALRARGGTCGRVARDIVTAAHNAPHAASASSSSSTHGGSQAIAMYIAHQIHDDERRGQRLLQGLELAQRVRVHSRAARLRRPRPPRRARHRRTPILQLGASSAPPGRVLGRVLRACRACRARATARHHFVSNT